MAGTLGTAALLNAGTSAGNVVQLDGDGKLPEVDGSQLTGVSGGTATLPTGTRLTGYWVAAPDGYVLADGTTIGNADSGATGRAHADTSDLFTLLWTNMDDALAPVSGGRGASAAADFADDKTIPLPDERLRVAVMARSGTMFAGVDGVLGAVGGEETHALSEAELPVVAGHTHTNYIDGSTFVAAGADWTVPLYNGDGVTAASGGFGSGAGHNNVQPFIVVNVAIKL